MKTINNSILALLLTLSAGMFLSTSVAAKTPDGVTPANEAVCDVLNEEGTTKGLYGLCIAYCAATDSPEDLSSDDKIASLPIRSKRMLNNYNKKRNDADPQMPCATFYEESNCPAWSTNQRDLVGTYGYRRMQDDRSSTSSTSTYIVDREYTSSRDVKNVHHIIAYEKYGRKSAAHIDVALDRKTGIYARNVQNVIDNLTQEEYDSCIQDVKDHVMPL